ncbi:UDP-N-acetylmuramoyl-L-alanyl-D-glutamate--2,6-diaminopimelate ligase [Priestia megaterium]|uniref:UDP-N-acetylmuramoyl-L-alanyl-D-glutamate--2, 6-diaminopimelate ligase n=1 Tax=Priestia TaxID=2800373 RepID=UPI00211CEEA9|nr:UDP-N-acetylmuramoyl-L-alanyl-D-glutamate--2,6-diaminopimelate ligase [Priestia aryabhattai]MCQ9283944.1 UDP-N-acetylmuramoyl-L-alanyl-D-glutamate--2,6-diaminopimelate ligase [Priestia aryabhattai]
MNIHFDTLTNLSIKHIFGPASQTITHLTYHSKQVHDGSVFFSIKGENEDGHQYIKEAIARGAVAVFGTSIEELRLLSTQYSHCTFLAVNDVRKVMASFSKMYFDYTDEKIETIGVTGTNGKTTVAAYVRSLLTLLKLPTGSIGTTGIWSSKQKLVYKKSTPTTPESVDLHKIFYDLYTRGDEAAVMEVSSIAIDQQRVENIYFDVAIHTNLSEEHLEYHKTFEHYKKCKMKLFQQAKHAVINIDDQDMGKDLSRVFEGPKVTYSLLNNKEATLQATNITVKEGGSFFDLLYKGQSYKVAVPVYGDYNIANVLAAIGTALHFEYHIEDIISVLPQLESPEGRFQVIEGPNNQKVILDYAHTPVALTRLVEEVKKMEYNQLIVMIAGIGIRDFNKMPKMARTIEGKADEIIVTVDHPGYHDPNVIVDQVMTGFSNPSASNIHRAPTRTEGVLKSLSLGKANDIILLTSGCINGAQLVKGNEIPHSDEEIIASYYASLSNIS